MVKMNDGKSSRKTAPGPRGYPVIGCLPHMLKDPLWFMIRLTEQYGKIVRFRLASKTFHLVTHPTHVQHVLQEKNRNYIKGEQTANFDQILGEGLLTSKGTLWQRQRRMMQPSFSRKRLEELANIMVRTTDNILNNWQIQPNETVEITSKMSQLTLGVASNALFSLDVSGNSKAMYQAVATAIEYLNDRIWSPLKTPTWFPTQKNRDYQNSVQTIRDIVNNIITERSKNAGQYDDLLKILLAARDEESNEVMDHKQLCDEVTTLLLAGHETTSLGLSWMWYLLSKHPEVERTLRSEIASVLNGRLPVFEDLEKLTYCKMVIEESLRLYPPIWAILRKAVKDDTIDGYHIPGNSMVIMVPYISHRYQEFWDNPEGFDPMRFTEEATKKRPRFAYFPFGGGPRLCIGNRFALMESLFITTMMIQRYRLQLVPWHFVKPKPMIAFRPQQGIMMQICHNNYEAKL